MKFEDLRLTSGYPMQLQVNSEAGLPQRFPCRLIGYIPGRSVLLSPPRNKKDGRLRSGQKLVVSLMAANGIFTFSSSIDFLSSTPLPILHLNYPSAVNFKQIRGATRVDVNLPVEIRNLGSLDDLKTTGIIADISTSGARVELEEPIGEVGEGISIHTTVAIGSLRRALSIAGVIRSRIERSTREFKENLPAVYGIEFNETDENNLLVLNGYVFGEMVKSLEPRV